MQNRHETWTVEISIDRSWIADGFNLVEEKLQEEVNDLLPYATPEECQVKIIKAPNPEVIKRLQSGEEEV